MEKMKIAIYCRVSTEDQNVEQQVAPCVKRCEAEGWEYRVFEEKISGAKENRRELDLMMQAVRVKDVQAVMVYKLDRLGRSLKHLLQIIEELQNKGVKFISISEGFDTGSPMGRFGLHIMGSLAQMEREMISERTKLRLQYLKGKGQKLGRPTGCKDKKPRRKAGYYLRWAGGRARNPWGANPGGE